MIAEKVIEKAMKKVQGAQASLARTENYDVAFESDKIKSSRSNQRTSLNLKVILNGRIGNAITSDINDIDCLVAKALEIAEFGNPAYYQFADRCDGVDVKIYDDAVPPITKGAMVSMGEEMISLIKEYNPDIVAWATSGKRITRTEFANSGGQAFISEDTVFGAYSAGQLTKGNDILMAGRSESVRKKSDMDHKALAQKTIDLFKMSEKIAAVQSGNMPVIFTPEGVRLLCLTLGLGLNGKNVFLKSSPLTDSLGVKIADECITIIDDPLIDYGIGSATFDGEGVPHQKNILIENGVLKGFIYDLETAARAGVKSTGNGIGCNFTNTIIKEGSVSYEDMIKNTKEGLIVHNVIGGGQSNVISGEFSVNVGLGFKIENGEIVGRVKNVMLAGNVYDAIKNIEALGNKAEWVPGALMTPPVKIGRLSVTAN
jgi:PmbA protein